MATQEQPVTLTDEQMARIAAFLRDPGSIEPPTRVEEDHPAESEPALDTEDGEVDILVQTLTKERVARGLTQEAVAKRMGVTVEKLQLLESGTLDARLSTLRVWSKAVFMEISARSTKPGKGRIRANRR